jgi:hypothetical protein
MKDETTVRLQEKFFTPLLDNLRTLDKRLNEETFDGVGYIALLNKGWKSFWILDFRKFYRFEEEALFSLKQELEKYENDIYRFQNTGDESVKETILKRKSRIQKKISIMISRLEKLMEYQDRRSMLEKVKKK